MADEQELMEGQQKIVLPSTEDIPEKFRGKPVDEVLSSYNEAQKAMTKAQQEAADLRRQKEEIEKAQQAIKEPEEPEDNDDDAYSYLTQAQLKKRLEAQEKAFEGKMQKMQEEAVNRAKAEYEKERFIESHPDVFKGLDNDGVARTIQQIAATAYYHGERSLEGGFKAFQELAKRMGMSAEQPGNGGTRTVPSNQLGLSVEEQKQQDVFQEELDKMVKFQKQTSGRFNVNYK